MFLNPGGTRILHWPLSLSILLSLALSVSFCNECAIASSVSLYRIGGRCSYFYFLFVFSFFFLHKRACRKTGAAQKASASAPAGKDAYRIQRNWLAPIVVVYFNFRDTKKKYICEERARTDKEGSGGVCKAIECWTVLCKRL